MSAFGRRCAKAPAQRFTLVADQRGAMAVLGLFMAVFLTSAVFYLVGIGEAVLYRERMQDAADTAAFSAAVLHARGMNLLALINQIMAALLAILVALKLVEAVMSLAIVLISIASVFGGSALVTAIPTLTQLRQQTSELHRTLRPPIHRMLETLHAAGVAVRAVVPAASTARGHAIASSYRGSPVRTAVVMPASLTLPTQDGEFSDLCDKAGDYVGALSESALGVVPGAVRSAVGDAISRLSDAGALWFCGDAEAPSVEITQTVHHPVLPSVETCEQMNPAQPDYDARRHRELCERAEREVRAAQPDEHTGECTGECERSIYELRGALARRACAPRGRNDPLRDFKWQERRFTRTYEMRLGRFRVQSDPESERASERLRARTTDARPCGHERAAVGPDWHLQPRGEGDRPVPLCSDARPPQTELAREGAVRSIEHVEVTHLFGCTERVRRRYGVEGDQPDDEVAGDAESSEKKVPQLLLDGAELGDDHFQIRAIVFGTAPPSAPRRLVELASWGQDPSAGLELLGAAGAALGRMSFAQAEYFYALDRAGPYARSSLMWNMRWQARLRRFRLPEPAADDGALPSWNDIVRTCDAALGESGTQTGRAGDPSCESLDASFDLIVH